jgi:FtsH-binding integral membrane protein
MSVLPRNRATTLRLTVYVAVSTVFLTAAFFGVVAVITGSVTAFERRFPIYVLLSALAFVTVVLVLEDEEEPGAPILVGTLLVGGMALLGFSLAGEGLLYARANPDQVAGSELLFYFVAAALICTGLGYWAIHHWREFAGPG